MEVVLCVRSNCIVLYHLPGIVFDRGDHESKEQHKVQNRNGKIPRLYASSETVHHANGAEDDTDKSH